MAMTFYTWPRSSGTKVHWALEELGIPYQLHLIDRANREQRGPEYAAINPNLKVPALVDGDERFFESLAILLHLGERYGAARGLWPTDAPARAEALSWTVWSQTELQPYMMQFIYHGLDSPVSYPPDQRSRATADYNRQNFEHHLDMLEARLGGREHLFGDFSLVDVANAAILILGRRLGADLGARAQVTAWLDRCLARPALARAR
jgi:glutathione S-transferase